MVEAVLKKTSTSYWIALVASALLHCVNAFAEPATNLGQLKLELVTYHDSGAYDKEIQTIAEDARHYVVTEGQKNLQRSVPQKLAIVLDIDETSLSNYNIIQKSDFGYFAEPFKQELSAAKQPAIQPVLALYHAALEHNIAVFFITGRSQDLATATVENLHNAGYSSWSGLVLRNKSMPTVAFKTAARADIAAKGYTIIASIGDQYSDLVGGYAQKTFKLPNPYYYLP